MLTPRRFSLLLLLSSLPAFSQDPGTIAAQQASQQAQQASDQAMRDAQAASQNASQSTIQTNNVAIAHAAAPTFSVRPRVVAAGTQVRLKSRTHYATIYYTTTDGWSPTANSTLYTGPITIAQTTTIRAIAVAPNVARSMLSTAKYVVEGTQKTVEPLALNDGVLRAGTQLELVTDATINSKTAQVGDPLKLALAQDVLIGDHVVLAKGTPVEAKITQADPAGHAGTPGDVAFEVHTLTIGGRQIALHGGATLEGEDHYHRTAGLAIIPVVGIASLAQRGEEAEIKPGMTLSASVVADTSLQP